MTAIDRNSLFEVSIGLAQMVTKENIVQVGDIVPVITMVGALLFLASLIVQAFNFVFLSKLLDFEIVKSVYKFAVNDSFKYYSQTSLDRKSEARPITWLQWAKDFELGWCQRYLQVSCLRCLLPGSQQKKMHRMFHKGTQKIESILDVRSIIQTHKLVVNLTRMLLPSSKDRALLYL